MSGPAHRRLTQILDNEDTRRASTYDGGERRRSSIFDINVGSRRSLVPLGTSTLCEGTGGDDDLHQTAKKQIQYENTYRMTPNNKFQAGPVTDIIRECLESRLDGVSYDPINCSQLTKELTSDIKTQVKALKFDRYKIVVHVMVGQKNDTSVRIGTRCLWDTHFDSFGSANFENGSLFAVGNVFGIYYE